MPDPAREMTEEFERALNLAREACKVSTPDAEPCATCLLSFIGPLYNAARSRLKSAEGLLASAGNLTESAIAAHERAVAAEARAAALEKERDEAIGLNRHLSEKHEISMKSHEFLRSRNLKRRCDSDGFIACERCQAMSLCIDYEEEKARAAEAEGLLAEARELLNMDTAKMLDPSIRGVTFGQRIDREKALMKRVDAFLARGKGGA